MPATQHRGRHHQHAGGEHQHAGGHHQHAGHGGHHQGGEGGGGGGKLPFIWGSQEQYVPIAAIPVTMGQKAATVRIPKNGFLLELLFRFVGNANVTAAGTAGTPNLLQLINNYVCSYNGGFHVPLAFGRGYLRHGPAAQPGRRRRPRRAVLQELQRRSDRDRPTPSASSCAIISGLTRA